ncbi:MAG: peptide deformylase [Burkholderiales bacterium]|jgi:peptide deformylase|nr:peptide deformylase [Betaproteobacteria bacterium]
MALLKLLHYPDERLRTIARPIAVVDDRIRQIVKDMTETMYAAPGIGLAATQVNIHERLILVDTSEDQSDLRVLINPEIVGQGEDLKVFQEGCLSVPGIFDDVERPDQIRVRALNEKGETLEFDADGLLSVCIQHEIDHLNGKVFVDYLSRLKQGRIKTKMIKAKESGAFELDGEFARRHDRAAEKI